MMNSEFINIFIQKQKSLITELQSKLLLAESQVELNNELLKKANEENLTLRAEVDKLSNKKARAQASE
jgi:hypothetical protein